MNWSEVRDGKLNLIRRILHHGCLCNQARHFGLSQFPMSYYSVIVCMLFTVTQKVFRHLLKNKKSLHLDSILHRRNTLSKKNLQKVILNYKTNVQNWGNFWKCSGCQTFVKNWLHASTKITLRPIIRHHWFANVSCFDISLSNVA